MTNAEPGPIVDGPPTPALVSMTARDKRLMRDLRYAMRENQTQFWHRFGVGQSSGSRFERGMPMPLPLLLLIRLYFLHRIGDADLRAVRAPDYDGAAAEAAGAVLNPARQPGPGGWP